MLVHVRDVVFPWLKSDLAAKGDLFAQAMKDAVFIIPKGSLMVEMTNTIDKIYELIAKEEAAGQSTTYMSDVDLKLTIGWFVLVKG